MVNLELETLSIAKEAMRPYFGIGIVLTNSARILPDGKIIPDLEGKKRLLLALEDLINGVAQKVIITGGKIQGIPTPLGKIYGDYAREILQRYSRIYEDREFLPSQIEAFTGGGETISDVEEVIQALEKRGEEEDLILYTSKWHVPRSTRIIKRALEKRNWILTPLVAKETIPISSFQRRLREAVLGTVMDLDEIGNQQIGSRVIRLVALKLRER